MLKCVILGDYYDQMQFGMYVFGFDEWFYGWEVMGEGGMLLIEDLQYWIVECDQICIVEFVVVVDVFFDWIDNGVFVEEISFELEVVKVLMIVVECVVKVVDVVKVVVWVEFMVFFEVEFFDVMKIGWKYGDDLIVIFVCFVWKMVVDEVVWFVVEFEIFDEYQWWCKVVEVIEEVVVKFYLYVMFVKFVFCIIFLKVVKV